MIFDSDMINIFENSTVEAPSVMKTDIQEKDGSYLFEIELPGYLREDIQAELVGGKLTIIANRPEHIDSGNSKTVYIRRERPVGTCRRSFYVGNRVRQEDISAAFSDGVLSIIISNPEKAVEREKRKLIPIK